MTKQAPPLHVVVGQYNRFDEYCKRNFEGRPGHVATAQHLALAITGVSSLYRLRGWNREVILVNLLSPIDLDLRRWRDLWEDASGMVEVINATRAKEDSP